MAALIAISLTQWLSHRTGCAAYRAMTLCITRQVVVPNGKRNMTFRGHGK